MKTTALTGRSADPIITIISRRSAAVPYNNNNYILFALCAREIISRSAHSLDIPMLKYFQAMLTLSAMAAPDPFIIIEQVVGREY